MNLSPQAQALAEALSSGEAARWPQDRVAAMRPFAAEALAAAKDELNATNAAIADCEERLAIFNGLASWLHGDFSRLGQNEHSRAHKLFEAFAAQKVVFSDDSAPSSAVDNEHIRSASVFVVRHDWAGALGQAVEESAGDVSLPFDSCIFEFVINGRCVIVWAVQPPGDTPKAVPFVQIGDHWYCSGKGTVGKGSPFHFAWLQIVAICIALDAEVATHEVVRAPVALNRKREKQGKVALKDFHIIDLSKRHRVASQTAGTGEHRGRRLHFRRGHWRHYEDHKTWIKWMLVGNPDLGFVEKHYRV